MDGPKLQSTLGPTSRGPARSRSLALPSVGSFALEGDRIAFTAVSESRRGPGPDGGERVRVAVDHEGAVSHEGLTLRSHSHFNGHEETLRYAFVACALAP